MRMHIWKRRTAPEAIASALLGFFLLMGMSAQAVPYISFDQEADPGITQSQETAVASSQYAGIGSVPSGVTEDSTVWKIPGHEEKETENKKETKETEATTPVQERADTAINGNEEKADDIETAVSVLLDGMTREEKAAQLFFVTPEQLLGIQIDQLTGLEEEAFLRIPVGGILMLPENLRSEEQIRQLNEGFTKISMEATGLPVFLAVEEEGGSDAVIAGKTCPQIPAVVSMRTIGDTNNTGSARKSAAYIGSYLSRMGFSVNLAPLSETASADSPLYSRTFGEENTLVADMVGAVTEGFLEEGLLACLSWFPGQGKARLQEDEERLLCESTKEELTEGMLPFKAGIQKGAAFVRISHSIYPAIDEQNRPASLCEKVYGELLREEMGFEGIAMTDAMDLPSILSVYDGTDAVILAIEAGADMILLPKDLQESYQAVLAALENGVLSEARVDEAVRRILRVKLTLL